MTKKRKPNGALEQIMDICIEITDFSWKFGAVVSAIFLLSSLYALEWAVAYNNPDPANGYITAVVNSLGWLVYFIPLMLLVFAILFAWRAFVTYSRQCDW